MEEILHQLIGSESHYLHGFLHPKWVFSPDFWTINVVSTASIRRDTGSPESIRFPLGFVSIFALRHFKLPKKWQTEKFPWVGLEEKVPDFSGSLEKSWREMVPMFFFRCSRKNLWDTGIHADDLASRSPFLGQLDRLHFDAFFRLTNNWPLIGRSIWG